MRRPQSESERGKHTLEVRTGTVVGRYRNDVFVELGERMQGVAMLEDFPAPPPVGATFEFTLRGQEETLWVLRLVEQPTLETWEELEVGALVDVKIVRGRVGGLEGKVGKLHAFLPKSQTGLARGHKAEELLGQSLVCQVMEVDAERQRTIVSRRAVLKGTDSASRAAREGRLTPGMRIEGRVVRVERYGVFLAFGDGLTGLAHRTELAWGHVRDARELFRKGEHVPAVVMTVRQGGKRISLGTKQLTANPWPGLEERVGALLPGRVVAAREWGAQVEAGGVVGFVPAPELGAVFGPAGRLVVEQDVVVRVVAVDAELERLNLALRDPLGRKLLPEDLEHPDLPDESEHFGRGLGALLGRALETGSRKPSEHNGGGSGEPR
ncbi:MAG: S1 RNA-binding domain-containing protein [Planctomycetota bacterium]